MLKRFTFFLLMLVPVALFAQDVEKGAATKKTAINKPARDFVMLQFTYEGWDKPDSIKTTGIGRGFNAYLCYDFPIKNSNFSFAAGIGIGTSNIYFKDQVLVLDNLTDSVARFVSDSAAGHDYKKSKLTTAYLEAPFELRFFSNRMNRNKGFKMAVGFRVGTMIGAHTKVKQQNNVVRKVNTKNHLESWRFAVTGRIGWGNYALVGSYNLNKLFDEGQGPVITPYSIGISITGL
jgi:Outer membrane protein beta-barrel domain